MRSPRVAPSARSVGSSGVRQGQSVTNGRGEPQTTHCPHSAGLSIVQTRQGYSFIGLSKRCHWYCALLSAQHAPGIASAGSRRDRMSCSVSTHSTTASFSSPLSGTAPKSKLREPVCNENQWCGRTSVGMEGPL
jgi:hypothetical protein